MAALLNEEETLNASLSEEQTINTEVPPINYIPGYKIAEAERRANEIVRQSNEANRIALYEDMEAKLESGYFKGDKGDAATISVGTTTTGAAGTNASVTNSGTSSAAVFDFTIPKGDKGDKGDPGEIQFLVVVSLPETGTTGIIYLVPITPDTSGNNYAEYIWVNNSWELLGKIGVQVDLTDYVKTSSLANVATSGSYNDLLNTPTIPTISDSYGTSTVNGYSQNYINTLVGDIDSALDLINGEVI